MVAPEIDCAVESVHVIEVFDPYTSNFRGRFFRELNSMFQIWGCATPISPVRLFGHMLHHAPERLFKTNGFQGIGDV